MIPELTHAPFVWSSYAIFVAVAAWQFAQPLIRRRRIRHELLEAFAEREAARRMKS